MIYNIYKSTKPGPGAAWKTRVTWTAAGTIKLSPNTLAAHGRALGSAARVATAMMQIIYKHIRNYAIDAATGMGIA